MLQPGTGVEMLKVVPVSQAQANQRAGRSGRECPGKCFRLYTEETYEDDLQENSVPEIERVNVSQVILQLKAIGVADCIKFPYVTPPSTTSLRAAFELLIDIGALDKVCMDRFFFLFVLDS
jgi:HrpA-like RNA helicase